MPPRTDSEATAPTTTDHILVACIAGIVAVVGVAAYLNADAAALMGLAVALLLNALLVYNLNRRIVAVLHRQRKRKQPQEAMNL